MDIQTLLQGIGAFLNSTVMPFIIALAALVFMWNAFRYFILGGSNPTEQEKAKTLALWGIAAFVFILSLWGIVNVISDDLIPQADRGALTPDYIIESN